MRLTRRAFLAALLAIATFNLQAQQRGAVRSMSTVLKLGATRTTLAGVDSINYDIAVVTSGAALFSHFLPVTGGTKIPIADVRTTAASVTTGSGLTYAFISWRLASDVTIASGIGLTHYGRDFAKFGSLNATFRFELSKITTSGNVETLIGALDEPAIASGEVEGTIYSTTIPVPTPIPVVTGERLIVRVFLVPAPGQTMIGSVNSVSTGYLHSPTSVLPTFTFAETFTLTPNLTRLYQRRTSVAGIGNFFDLLTTKVTQTQITSTVTATNAATEIQWTRAPAAAFDWFGPIVSITDTSNASSYVSAAFTPFANRLYLLGVVHSDAAPEATEPTVTSTTGLTFVKLGSVPYNTIASNTQRLTVFRAMKASGLVNGTITVNLADAGTGLAAMLIQVTGTVTTGTDGADAVRNIVTNNADASANPSITMGTYASSLNGTVAFFATNSTVPTAGTGFTASGSTSYATPTTTVFSEVKWGNTTTATATAASQAWAGLAMEVVTDVVATTNLEWISPRLAASWYFDSPDATVMAVPLSQTLAESNAAVNAAFMVRLFRWRNGVETQFYEYRWQTEIAISSTPNIITPTTVTGQTSTPTGLQPDDRIVLRMYVIPVAGQTLAPGTAIMGYDAGSAALPTAYVDLIDLPVTPFKAETDPASPPTIPNSGMTMGVQN